MKNLSLALNAILLVLVIVLFVMVNNLKKSMGGGNNDNSAAMAGKSRLLKIAYVNADSINANYMMMKDLKNDLEAKQSQLQTVYNEKAKRLQDEYQGYMQKKQAGNISEMDAQKAEQDMQAKKNELDGMQQQQQELMKDAQDKNLEIEKMVQKYITDYNKNAHFDFVLGYESVGGSLLFANDSLDITRPIVNGLNQQYKDSALKTSTGAKH